MPKCRPGDLAVVVQARFRCNLGKIVQIVGPHDGTGDLVFDRSWGVVWWIKSSRRLSWISYGKVYRRKTGPCPDSKLRPIRGEPHAVETHRVTDEKVIAT